MLRLFVGIPLPELYHEKMASLVEILGSRLKSKVRWSRPENWHLTLKFLGNVEEGRVDDIRSALSAIRFHAFDMRPGECGCFPDMQNPRVIWKGVSKGSRPCEALAAVVDEALAELGFERNKRSFKCHLTLGRVKQLRRDDWAASLQNGDPLWPGFTVDRVMLWQSELTPEGPRYSVLGEFPLLDKR